MVWHHFKLEINPYDSAWLKKRKFGNKTVKNEELSKFLLAAWSRQAACDVKQKSIPKGCLGRSVGAKLILQLQILNSLVKSVSIDTYSVFKPNISSDNLYVLTFSKIEVNCIVDYIVHGIFV